jgi:hypothetical protein
MMRDCEYIDKCVYYCGWVDRKSETQSLAKKLYCHMRPERCKRNQMAKERPVEDIFNTVFPLDGGVFSSE